MRLILQKAREMKFGSNLKRFGDIGVDLSGVSCFVQNIIYFAYIYTLCTIFCHNKGRVSKYGTGGGQVEIL